MITAFIVYPFLMLYMFLMGWLTKHMKEKPTIFNITTILSILLFTVILGLRYDVGVDYLSYLHHYQALSYYEGQPQFEPLYEWLNQTVHYFNLHYSVLFSLTVFIEIVFFYLIFVQKRFLLPYAILFFFLTSKVFLDLNIIRHAIATMIFIYSIRYIQENSFWKYSLFLLLACGFHYSCFLLFPIWFLGSQKHLWIDRRFWCLCLFGITLFLGSGILDSIMEYLIGVFQFLGYSNYVDTVEDWEMEVGSGLGIILLHVLDLIIVLLVGWLNKYIHDKGFVIYSRIFFIGVLLANIFGLNVVLSRISFPLVSVRFIVLAYIFYYLIHYWKMFKMSYKCMCGFVFLSYLILFISNIALGANKCSPFQFVAIL